MSSDGEVRQAIATFLKKPIEKVADDALLVDLVSESFVLVEMVIDLQETFGARFGQAELQSVRTVGDLLALFRPRA